MNDATLEGFRRIAEMMHPEPHDWQWIGQWMSQRMFGITEKRAKEYAARHGGEAKRMGTETDIRAVVTECQPDWKVDVFVNDEYTDGARASRVSEIRQWLSANYPRAQLQIVCQPV